MKYLKTPLRYPGGKSRVAKDFIPRFPEGDETHLTWYCRPNMNPELIEERTKRSR